MTFEQERELDDLSWKTIEGKRLSDAEQIRYRDLYIQEKAERGVAIKPWRVGKLHGATITPQ